MTEEVQYTKRVGSFSGPEASRALSLFNLVPEPELSGSWTVTEFREVTSCPTSPNGEDW
jgi:hypothetical protein